VAGGTRGDAKAMIDYMRPADVPACECGDLCDRQTVKGEWYHSACDDTSRERAMRTKRILELRAAILRREGKEG
jgi:hypothetical protein